MMQLTAISIRLTKLQKQKLALIARQRQMQTGRTVTTSELTQEAVEAYLAKNLGIRK
jgi:hypothetical protein